MSHHQIRQKRDGTGHASDWYALWPAFAICAFLSVIAIFAFVSVYWQARPHKSDIPVLALSEGQDLHLDPSKLSARQLHIFEVNVSGKKEKFIVQRTPDAIVHVALASCKACYRNHNSHYAKSGEMICGACKGAMVFESKGRKADPNHCALAEIPHSETDRELTVSSVVVLAEAAKLPQ